jgi:hypothetical protein
MKKILITIGIVFITIQLISQSYYNPNHYYYEGVPQYWTEDPTSANIIVKNMSDYNAIVNKLQILFSNSTDEILADDNMIIKIVH